MTERDALDAWLRREIEWHLSMQKQHEALMSDQRVSEFQRETGAVMAIARGRLIEELRWQMRISRPEPASEGKA